MEVRLGNYGNVVIGHKTMLGLAQHIEKIGNEIREQKGLKPKKLDTFMRKESTWEKIIEISNRESVSWNHEEVLFSCINQLPRDSKNQIKYSEITKTGYFDDILKRQTRGKLVNRGTWMHLILLLDYAEWYDVSLWYEVHKQFIEGNILQHRDDGGEQFKLLNAQIDTLTDRLPDAKPKGNKGVYIQISKLVRTKLEIVDSFGYNEDDHTAAVQNNRDEMLKTATNLIKMGMITTYPQLKAFILNYPITK